MFFFSLLLWKIPWPCAHALNLLKSHLQLEFKKKEEKYINLANERRQFKIIFIAKSLFNVVIIAAIYCLLWFELQMRQAILLRKIYQNHVIIFFGC